MSVPTWRKPGLSTNTIHRVKEKTFCSVTQPRDLSSLYPWVPLRSNSRGHRTNLVEKVLGLPRPLPRWEVVVTSVVVVSTTDVLQEVARSDYVSVVEHFGTPPLNLNPLDGSLGLQVHSRILPGQWVRSVVPGEPWVSLINQVGDRRPRLESEPSTKGGGRRP